LWVLAAGVPLLLASSCPPRSGDAVDLLESAYRRVQKGQLEEGLSGYARAVERLRRVPPGSRAPWDRAFMLYTLHKAGGVSRLESRYRERIPGWSDLSAELGVEGGSENLLESALVHLHESGFHEIPGRWSRMPRWAMTETLQLCGDGLRSRAESPGVLLESAGEEIPARIADLLAREAICRIAIQFHLRAWELAAAEPKPQERDCRIRFEGAARLLSEIQKEMGAHAADPRERAALDQEAADWERRANAAQENAALAAIGLAADMEFLGATPLDHYAAGLASFAAAIEERAGRGTPSRALARHRDALAHLLVAREFKGTITREEESRLEILERSVRAMHRILNGQ
jgi:hypothetical protein